MLLEMDLKTMVIVVKCEFREARHLNKTFQRHEQVTPSEYRRKRLRREAEGMRK